MKEKLIIKNFGPIKSVELELGKVNVLIGEQGTGKSTVAKLLAVCRYFSSIISPDYFLQDPFGDGLSLWGLNDAIKENSFIYYDCKHYSFTAKRISSEDIKNRQQNEEYRVPEFDTILNAKSKEFEHLLNELENINPKSDGLYGGYIPDQWSIPTSFLKNDVASVLDNPYYVFTERGLQSVFSLGKNSIPNLSDSLYNYFDKTSSILSSFRTEIYIEPLRIKYKNVNGRGYIKSSKHDFINLADSASGFQSMIPIVLLIKYYSEIRKKSKTFIIEEPELNLFPETQAELIKYLVSNVIKFNNQILLTTHSPYILTSLNNLLYAYTVGQTHFEEANKIIDNKYWLNPDDISVYMMLTDGGCEDILDHEEGMIKAEKIDGITNTLNNQFSELLNLELASNEFNS